MKCALCCRKERRQLNPVPTQNVDPTSCVTLSDPLKQGSIQAIILSCLSARYRWISRDEPSEGSGGKWSSCCCCCGCGGGCISISAQTGTNAPAAFGAWSWLGAGSCRSSWFRIFVSATLLGCETWMPRFGPSNGRPPSGTDDGSLPSFETMLPTWTSSWERSADSCCPGCC